MTAPTPFDPELDVIGELRSVVPRRGLSLAEGRRVAELQAAKFLELAGVSEPAVPDGIVPELAGVRVLRRRGWPTSGMATATDSGWAIVLKAEEAIVRQRFSLIHEFKHVLDDPFIEWLYPTIRGFSPEDRAEVICDYFAACVLMPKTWIKRDFAGGIQAVERLAKRYRVSRPAMERRLQDLQLLLPSPRCAGTRRTGMAA